MAEAANVVEIRKPNAKGDEGLGVVLEFQISQGQQLQFSTCLTQGDSLEQWNETLDKMRKAGERQKTIAEIQSLKKNVLNQQRELNTSAERFEIAEREYQEDKLARNARVTELQIAAQKVREADETAFGASGKRGEYKPTVAGKQRLGHIDSAIGKESEAQAKADVERENAIKSRNAEKLSIDKTIVWATSEIERLEALLTE